MLQMSEDLPSRSVRGLFDWFIETCLAVLVGALALTAAVWLLEAIWPALVIVVGCIAGIALVVLGVRWWRSRW